MIETRMVVSHIQLNNRSPTAVLGFSGDWRGLLVKNAELSSISDGAENKAELLHGSCQISTTEWAVVVPFSCKSRLLYRRLHGS